MRLDTILDNIDNGAIALPEFQRGYVWSRPQVRGLVESLYRGHPVGSLLTWLTRTEEASTRGDAALQPGTVQLLLDGQQRVTSLYGLIRGQAPPFFDGNEKAFQELKFHLDDERFEFWQPVKMRDDARWVDVTTILQRGAGAVIGELAATSSDDPRFADWIARINRIGEIRNRDFHIEQVTGEDKTVDVVVDIFNRVNSGGTKLSKGDLALAKVCAEWPPARDVMKERLSGWSDSGFTFGLEWYLRLINAIVTGRAPFSALAEVPPAEIRDAEVQAGRAVDKILNTIGSRLGLNHTSVLPSVYPFIVLGKYLVDNGMSFGDHEQRDRMLYWYLQASMWGRYAGSTETVLAQDLAALAGPGDPSERLLALVRQQRGDLRVKPGDFWAWSRGARFFPILYMLTRVTDARDWGTGERLDQAALGRYSDLEVHHIFPKRVLYDAGLKRPQVNAIANFTFLTLETNRRISDREPSEYLADYLDRHPGAIASHWVPIEPELWSVDRYDEFLERRRALLADEANAFLGQLYAGHLGERELADLRPPVEADIAAGPTAGEDEEQQIAELQTWVAECGFDAGHLDYELVDGAGAPVAVLDVAWPRGLQPELSERVALLLNEPERVVRAAVDHGYRPFTSVESFRSYVSDLATMERTYDEEALSA